jgi:hypothetical protein
MKETIKSIYSSIILNWRDLFVTFLVITVILGFTNIVTSISDKCGLNLDDLRDFIFALGKFAAVVLCGVGYLTHVTFRGSLGKFDAKGLMETWNSPEMTDKERFGWFMKTCFVGIIAAALVFSIGV